MTSIKIVQQIISSSLPSVAICKGCCNIIIDYYLPCLLIDKNLLHDICCLWMTKKGLDRTYIYWRASASSDAIDGYSIDFFKSKEIKELYWDYLKMKKSLVNVDNNNDNNHGSNDDDNKEEKKEENETVGHKMLSFIKKGLQKYLSRPILFSNVVHLQSTILTPLVFEDTASPYMFSEIQNRSFNYYTPLSLVSTAQHIPDRCIPSDLAGMTLNDEAIEDDNDSDRWAEIEKEMKAKAEKREILLKTIIEKDPYVLHLPSETKSIRVHTRIGQNDFTLQDLLCACNKLKDRMAGLFQSREFHISGLTSCGYPIISIFFEEDKVGIDRGHIFYD